MASAALKEQLAKAVSGKPVLLTPETVVDYVAALKLPLLAGKTLTGSDSSTGNLNYCFIVAAEGGTPSVFVKQAPDFVKCLGEDAKLTTDRIRTEISAALEFGTCAPGYLPEIYHFDATSCVCVMEHLASHTLLQDHNLQNAVTDGPAVAVAQFMGKVHGSTFSANGAASSSLASSFVNEPLCGITSAYVFTLPFITDDSNSNEPALDSRAAELRGNEALKAAITAAHDRFKTKKEALLHGDLHSGSVMTDGSDAKVIDHEFAFFGPAGFDLGLFLAGYTFPYAVALVQSDEAKMKQLSSAMRACVSTYFALLREAPASLPDATINAIWNDALSFMGCELLRRVLGAAKRQELQGIEDKAVKIAAERAVLKIGELVLTQTADIADTDALLKIIGASHVVEGGKCHIA